jgi:DNA-binding PadR family transcriptional regulator
MSSAIYGDIEAHEAQGLIEGEYVPGYSWKRYRISPQGLDVARGFRDTAPTEAVQELFRIKKFVAERTFNQLLREVYAAYPDSAVNNVFSV